MFKNKKTDLFNFDNSYLNLPDKFYSLIQLAGVENPKTLLFNSSLAEELGMKSADNSLIADVLSGNRLAEGSEPIAQAYAGHQFGGFTMLGDGRAVLLGEQITPNNQRFDIQLKGGGRTPYSRGGDGKATLKAMLKEYLISESLHGLELPTSRSLAVIGSAEKVRRETMEDRAILTRVMKSHIRVGTFEYARYYGEEEDLRALTDYTINRLYPELKDEPNPVLSFFEKVMYLQAELVVNWMRVGFVHGVMNTDNTSISAETFDYGPCAFLSVYNPAAVFSSIDTQGRYAYANQPSILKWNLARFAETLLPLIDSDEKKAIELVTDLLNEYDAVFKGNYMKMMLGKIGIETMRGEDNKLLALLLNIMNKDKLDYNHTFTWLKNPEWFTKDEFEPNEALKNWKKQWLIRLNFKADGKEAAFELMKKYNPVLVPNNFQIESILERGEAYDFSLLKRFLKLMENPYEFKDEMKEFMFSPLAFDSGYVTYCGT